MKGINESRRLRKVEGCGMDWDPSQKKVKNSESEDGVVCKFKVGIVICM